MDQHMSLSGTLVRIRGAVSLALTWAVTWGAAAGLVGGAITSAVLWTNGFSPPYPELVGAFALAGALSGAVSGLGFAVIVAGMGRRRTLAELSARRLGLLSALPALAIGAMLFGVNEPLFILGTGLFGFAAGTGTLTLARRGALSAPATARAELTRG
jgi:hypothetical protein